MKDNILILPIDPETFAVQTYSQKDIDIISTSEVDTAFSQSTDYIEYYVYDENQNLIYPNNTEELLTYTIKEGHVNLDPIQDLQRLGFDEGNYFSNYYFYRKHLGSSIQENYYISEISANRTEIRLSSSTIANDTIISSSNDFIEYRENQNYFVDFYLNFGLNDLIIANNIQLDTTVDDDPTILIKLYEPLPSNIDLKSQCWVIEDLSTSKGYQVKFPIPVFEPQDFSFIAGPNYSLDIKNESGTDSEVVTYNTLIGSDVTSSQQQIQSLLQEKGININVNYEDRSEYIKFSSALTRLENFYYKVGLIEDYQNQIVSLTTNITGSTTGSLAYSSSKSSYQGKIDNILTNLDQYEYFLYYNSGSESSYPKSTSTKPYTLSPTGSTEVLNWLGSANPSNAYYGGQALSASNYDQENQDWLYWSIPEYLRDDPENQKYELFVDMIGQHFDNIWIYSKDIVNKFDADNRLDYGISKDLVADAIKDFGVKLYSNNFNTNDLYEAFLGITPSGSYFPSTGSEHINTMISASNDAIPLDDVNKRLYKRIYHNIPYLLKTKGTVAGLKALITSYGIPDTILKVNEFGDQALNTTQNWELEQKVFNYKLDLDGTNYITSSFNTNEEFDQQPTPKTIQFRFKTPGIPTGSINQLLYTTETNQSALVLSYTGSNQISGSYSGSITNLENTYGTVTFYPQGIVADAPTASVYLPVFDGGWWTIQTSVDYDTTDIAKLSVANKGDHTILHKATSSIACTSSFYEASNWIYFPASQSFSGYEFFSGSLQEIRYWGPEINQSSFNNFVLNPYSCVGNSVNSTPNELAFRAALGTMLNTGSRLSIHPTITGSSITSSFEGNATWNLMEDDWDTSYFYWNSSDDENQIDSFYLSSGSFSTNKETTYLNQVPVGIKNRITDKITLEDNIIPSGDTLSPLIAIEQKSYTSQNYTPNTNYLEVAFSPTNQVDNDIIAQIGNFNLGDYIGDPRQVSKSDYSYPDLDTLRNAYFEKYIHSYDVKDFIHLIKYFDNSLFKMIKDFTPARTSLSSGVVVKQHMLERNKLRATQVSYRDEQLTGSVKPFVQDYNSGSVYKESGGAGGFFNPYNGIDFHPSGADGTGADNRFGIEQSWDEARQTISGSVIYVRDDQREYYNGEFSGSEERVKLQRGLGFEDEDPCNAYYTWDNIPEYLYRIVAFSGSDDEYLVTELTGGIPPFFDGDDMFFNPTFSVDYLGEITAPILTNATFASSITYISSSGGASPSYELIHPSGSPGIYRTASFSIRVPNSPLDYRNHNKIIPVTASALQPNSEILTFDMITGSTANSSSGFEVNIFGNIIPPTVETASLYGNVIYSESISNIYYPAITSSLVRTAHITASVPYGWYNVGELISGSVEDLQEDLDLFYVYLGRSSSPSSACNNIDERFRLNNVTLKEATAIYRENDDSLSRILFASSGYYSDGDIIRYWTGTEFTTINRCSEYS
jgi:hypothetical protein